MLTIWGPHNNYNVIAQHEFACYANAPRQSSLISCVAPTDLAMISVHNTIAYETRHSLAFLMPQSTKMKLSAAALKPQTCGQDLVVSNVEALPELGTTNTHL